MDSGILITLQGVKKKKKKKKRLLYFKNDSNHKGFTLSIDTKTMIDIKRYHGSASKHQRFIICAYNNVWCNNTSGRGSALTINLPKMETRLIYDNDFLPPLTLEFYHKRLIISAQMAPNKPIILTCDQIKRRFRGRELGNQDCQRGHESRGAFCCVFLGGWRGISKSWLTTVFGLFALQVCCTWYVGMCLNNVYSLASIISGFILFCCCVLVRIFLIVLLGLKC